MERWRRVTEQLKEERFAVKPVGLVLGIVVFAALALLPTPLTDLPGYGRRPAFAAAVTAMMVVWWFTESLPIWLTACAPLVLFPLLGVFGRGPLGDARSAIEPYFDAYIFLFLGGMGIGAAMEQFGLHRRVALTIMRAIGTAPKRLLLGTLVATAAVSLWISNTASAVMMMPIGLAVVAQLEAASGGKKLWRFGTALMLGVAYASNVGGVGTKIGTGTNSIFCSFAADRLGVDIGFLHYIAIGFPFVVLFVPIVWAVLWVVAREDAASLSVPSSTLDDQLRALGPLRGKERRVAIVFAFAAVLWIAGDALRPLLAPLVPFKLMPKHYEATVAMLAAFVLMAWGALPFAAIKRIPWGALVLLGGSFAMAAGIEGSGLGGWLADELRGVAELPFAAQAFIAVGATVVLSAVASNTATINVALNVLPRSLPILSAATMAASCDFMLPAGTPPNAIVFGSGYIRLRDMIRTGFLLDVAAIVILTLYTLVYLRFLF